MWMCPYFYIYWAVLCKYTQYSADLAHDDCRLPGEGGASAGLHRDLADAGGPGDGDLAAGDHWGAVTIVSVAGDVLHVPGDIVDVGDHVPGHLRPQGVTIEVEGHVGGRGAHGNTQHLGRNNKVICLTTKI